MIQVHCAHILFIQIIAIQLIGTEYCDNSQKEAEMEQSKTCTTSAGVGDDANSLSKALVLYNEDAVLPLHRQSRTFRYVSHHIVIKQEWKRLGVAAVVWDAAEVLGEYLEKNPDTVHGKRVIELGAGSGLVGMVAALLGATVTITDREEVLDYLKTTVNDNLPSSAFANTTVMALDWTKPLHDFDDSYDIILGADIVYIEEVFEDLLRTLKELSGVKTVIFLSCRIRYDRDNYFLERLREYFVLDKILYEKEKDVNLYKAIKR